MQHRTISRVGNRVGSRAGAVVALAILLSALLSACLLSPGKFTSAIDLRRDGTFSFSYKGEVFMLGLSKLAEMGQAGAKAKFTAEPCHDDNLAERKCTAGELSEQRRSWEDVQKNAAGKAKKDADSMKAMMGGIDPTNPQAAEELAARLRRQSGWRSVIYKGDGLYNVDFAIAGRIDHDFTFPTIERFPMANAFVQLTRRNDGTVRIDAPGFAASGGGSPIMQMLAGSMGGGLGAVADDQAKKAAPNIPGMDGQLTLTTDGEVLANNTDEGPQADPAGKRLSWAVNPRTAAAPTALLRLKP